MICRCSSRCSVPWWPPVCSSVPIWSRSEWSTGFLLCSTCRTASWVRPAENGSSSTDVSNRSDQRTTASSAAFFFSCSAFLTDESARLLHHHHLANCHTHCHNHHFDRIGGTFSAAVSNFWSLSSNRLRHPHHLPATALQSLHPECEMKWNQFHINWLLSVLASFFFTQN